MRDETIEDIMMRIQKLMLENELLRTAIEQQDKDNQILRERLTMLQGANTMSNPKNISIADANQALEDVAEAVEELLTIIASNPDLTVIIERQKAEIKQLLEVIEEQKTEIKRLRKNSRPAF